MNSFRSWGGTTNANHSIIPFHWRHDPFPTIAGDQKVLPFGLGRSYGDSCLNDGGVLLHTAHLDRLIELDSEKGLLRCEAGVTLEEILRVIVPHGWFLPVVPGTQQVTVGGAIANDVHGKNHHQAGTFGRYVRRFELLRSDDSRRICSETENADWYRATIGGLGLTGLITWAELELRKIHSPLIRQEILSFSDIDQLLELLAVSDRSFEFTAAWLDLFAHDDRGTRGILFRGAFSEDPLPENLSSHKRSTSIPFPAPEWLLNPVSARTFNLAYDLLQRSKEYSSLIPYDSFFFPLDVVHSWNLLYGKRGFFQYQCVVPEENHGTWAKEILRASIRPPAVSYLVVFKRFGNIASPGLLSFPRPGYTITLDYPNLGPTTLELFDALDDIVRECGGAVYPAKDARMSSKSFQTFFPQWKSLIPFIDPQFSSNFWRRVTKE